MDSLIPTLYKNYGEYCNWRMIPSSIDGLLPVERRVLLSTYLIARNKFVKSVRIDGYCLGHFHAHGSAYNTIVQMVWNNFIIGQGNWGCPCDTKPAAARYTEAKLNPIMEKLAFELIDYVPWKNIDLDKEPIYLPVMYPLCLLGNEYTVGIGFGYRTFIPVYDIEDLYKRLLYLIGVRKRKYIIKPITDCDIISSDDDLENLLTTGKEKIKVRGIYKINKDDFSVSLKSWPPGQKIESIVNKFYEELNQGNIGYSDFSGSEKEYCFKVIKQKNKSDILEKFIKKLDDIVNGQIPFDVIVIDEKKLVKRTSVDQLLLNSYNSYLDISKKMLESEKIKYENILFEYNVLDKIRPFLSKYLKKTIDNYDESIMNLSNDTKIGENVIRLLFSKYKINKLLTSKIDKDEILNKIKYFEDELKDIKNYVLKKYGGQ
jgi:DNA gyrase/topoisomerase IV subunit A